MRVEKRLIHLKTSRSLRESVVTLEEGKSSENSLYIVEGVQFDHSYISPYFVTDSEKMAVEYDNCKVHPMILLAWTHYSMKIGLLQMCVPLFFKLHVLLLMKQTQGPHHSLGNGMEMVVVRSPLNSGLWISTELVLTLNQIIAAIVVLCLSRHEHPRALLFG